MKRRAILLGAIAIAGLMIYQASRLYIAWDLTRLPNLNDQILGAKLEGNAEAWDQIGEAVSSRFDNPQPELARSFFERAVTLNPRSARAWTDLAQEYEEQGNVAKARAALERAKEDYPISAEVAWKYGNFLLRQGQLEKGVGEMHRALLADPHLTPLAISRIWSIDPDLSVLLDQLLPQETGAYFQALDFLSASHEEHAALLAWDRIIRHPGSATFPLSSAFPFLDELIASGSAADAERVWRQALRGSDSPSVQSPDNSIIWNSSFEAPIADGGLGWRLVQETGDYISIDSSIRHSGAHSLRVDFTGGANLDFAGAQEFVPVTPNTAYHFECFMRTDAISTESGLLFEIVDASNHEARAKTSALTGSNPWTELSADFTTGASTHFLDVRLRRFPSRLFDNKLSGTVWVDDVRLTPKLVADKAIQ